MLKTDVFVWLTVNCKSLNFCSVDTLSAQLHCHMDYFIYCRHANSTHLPYSSFARNFEFSSFVIRIFKVRKYYNSTVFKFYLAKRWGGHGPLCPPCPLPPPGLPPLSKTELIPGIPDSFIDEKVDVKMENNFEKAEVLKSRFGLGFLGKKKDIT